VSGQSSNYSIGFLNILFRSRLIVCEYGNPEIGREHLLLGALAEPLWPEASPELLSFRLGLSPNAVEDLRQAVGCLIDRGESRQPEQGDVPLSESAVQLVAGAERLASELGNSLVRPLHLVLALLREDGALAAALRSAGVTAERVLRALRE
jgi:ATP-dependent Clp protease ATP-binding subunit ClpA